MINKDNYFNEINRIGVSKLPDALQDGHNLVAKATSEGKTWEGISPKVNEVIELQMQKLDEYLNDTKTEVVTKPKKQRKRQNETAPKPEKKLVKVRRSAKKTTPEKPVKKPIAKKKTAKRVKVIKPPKAPVTVKKYSLELQHIKRFAHLHGKDHKTASLQSLLTTIEKHIAADDYLNHRSMITDIATRLSKGLEAAQGATVMAITIEPAFREKVHDLVANAKVRMRTEFMAGINSEGRSKKQH